MSALLGTLAAAVAAHASAIGGNTPAAPARSHGTSATATARCAGGARVVDRSPVAPRAAGGDAWVGPDKVKHLVLAAHVESAGFAAATLAGLPRSGALAAAVGLAAAVSLGKEVHDRRRGGRFGWRDLAWDAAGIALATTLLGRVGYERAGR